MHTAVDYTAEVEQALASTPFIDIHTHLFPPAFGSIGLWGIDEMLTYHYLEAELFRFSSIEPEDYWQLDKQAQADLIWRTLFVEHTPLSEAARGVVAVLHALGLETSTPTLDRAREYFRDVKLGDYVTLGARVGVMAHISIGEGAQLAPRSSVVADVPPGARWGGLPAKPIKQWWRETMLLERWAERSKPHGRAGGPSCEEP